MNRKDFEFHENDEGILVNLVLDSFDTSEVQVIYLESESSDEKLVSDINFIIENQDKFSDLSKKEIPLYTNRIYKNKDPNFKLMKIYVFPDIEGEFGFIFRWRGDTEHGIGIRFSGLSIKKVGSSETAFL